MNQETQKRLNQLNQDFYKLTASEFDQSRQQPWEGWWPLLKLCQKLNAPLKILDLGCGNGRFPKFLHKHLKMPFSYVGLDSNPTLLQICARQVSDKTTHCEVVLQDLVTALVDHQPLPQDKFDLIAAFGIIHHLPGFTLRQKFLATLTTLLKPNGMIALSGWQFTNNHALIKRQRPPAALNFDPAELEPGDYFLDWQRGSQAVRYCHLVSQAELEQLLPPQLSISQSYQADGKDSLQNQYWILTTKTRSAAVSIKN